MQPRFLDVPDEFAARDTAKVLILPVAYEATTTYLKGTIEGPAKIIEASELVEWYDVELGRSSYRAGIHTLEEIRSTELPEIFLPVLEKQYAALLSEGKIIAMLGGEHTVTLAAVREHLKKYPGLTVLHLDAHADMREEYENTRYGHGCVMYHVADRGAAVVSVGVRAMDSAEADFIRERGIVSFPAHVCRRMDDLPSRVAAACGKKVYITIDMDVFDPGFVPGVGTPEPGGLDWYAVCDVVRAVCAEREVVGFDVVETRPLPDTVHSEFTAARLVYTIIGSVCNQ
jgi:agmatinase